MVRVSLHVNTCVTAEMKWRLLLRIIFRVIEDCAPPLAFSSGRILLSVSELLPPSPLDLGEHPHHTFSFYLSAPLQLLCVSIATLSYLSECPLDPQAHLFP